MSSFARSILAGLALLAALQAAPGAAARYTPGAQTAPAPAAFQGTARVTGIADGDTIYVEIDGQAVRLRMAHLDYARLFSATGIAGSAGFGHSGLKWPAALISGLTNSPLTVCASG